MVPTFSGEGAWAAGEHGKCDRRDIQHSISGERWCLHWLLNETPPSPTVRARAPLQQAGHLRVRRPRLLKGVRARPRGPLGGVHVSGGCCVSGLRGFRPGGLPAGVRGCEGAMCSNVQAAHLSQLTAHWGCVVARRDWGVDVSGVDAWRAWGPRSSQAPSSTPIASWECPAHLRMAVFPSG